MTWRHLWTTPRLRFYERPSPKETLYVYSMSWKKVIKKFSYRTWCSIWGTGVGGKNWVYGHEINILGSDVTKVCWFTQALELNVITICTKTHDCKWMALDNDDVTNTNKDWIRICFSLWRNFFPTTRSNTSWWCVWRDEVEKSKTKRFVKQQAGRDVAAAGARRRRRRPAKSSTPADDAKGNFSSSNYIWDRWTLREHL